MSTKQAVSEPLAAQSPSLFNLRTVTWGLLLFAIAISGYLTYAQITNTDMVCVDNGAFNCGVVQKSVYAELVGIKIAYLGFATNLVLVGIMLLESRVPFLRDNGLMIFFAIVLFGFLFSVYLVYIQAFVLEAYCPWCLTHEVIYTVLFAVTIWRVRSVLMN